MGEWWCVSTYCTEMALLFFLWRITALGLVLFYSGREFQYLQGVYKVWCAVQYDPVVLWAVKSCALWLILGWVGRSLETRTLIFQCMVSMIDVLVSISWDYTAI